MGKAVTNYGTYEGPYPDESGAPGAHLFGWMSPEELDWLHARASESRNVAEIGCFMGRSTYALCSGCKGKVYAIDPHDPTLGDPTAHWGSSWTQFCENVADLKNIVIIREASPAAAAQVPRVDFTFIDGDHTAAGLSADLVAWIPKTRKLIAGHDYDHSFYPDVTPVVHAFFEDGKVNVLKGTGIWWVKLG